MENYDDFCKSKNCEQYIEWDYHFSADTQPYPCVSCQIVGQSYNIEEYPTNCPHIDEIKNIELDEKSN